MLKNVIRVAIVVLAALILLQLLNIFIIRYRDEQQRLIEEKSIIYEVKEIDDTPNLKKEVSKSPIINYELVLELPKINLKKGILSIDDPDNNIDKNVTILKGSVHPDEEGNIYIAAHSGTGKQSYFNDLVKMQESDLAYLYYQNNKYVYEVYDIVEIAKNDGISILTDRRSNLFLITCSQKHKDKYLILMLSRKS